MQKKPVKLLLQFISISLTVGVLYFAYVYGKELVANADFSGLAGNYWLLALAFLCFLLFYGIFSVHWFLVCRLVRREASAWQIGSFFASQPYKYLPTSLFTFSFRAKFAKQLGLSLRHSTYAQLLENFNIIGAAIAMGILFYLLATNYIYAVLYGAVAALVLIFLYTQKVVFTIPKIRKLIPLYKMTPLFLVACLVWVAGGISFLLVNYALGLKPDIWLAFAANAFGYAFSILAVFAPGGIGVRELILGLFSLQNSAIVLWRLMSFVVDILVGLTAVVVLRVMRRKIGQ